MTKYEEFLEKHDNSIFREDEIKFRQELDEVIIEKLHKFMNHYNDWHGFTIDHTDIDKFLQNKEE